MSDNDEKFIENGNCGFGHSLNPGPIMHRNFRHRSHLETTITEAYWQRRPNYLLTVLPVFTNVSRRIELDFGILKDGIFLGIEIDSSWHEESMLEAEKRLKTFSDNFIHIMRFKAPDDADVNWAFTVLDRVEKRIQEIAIFNKIGIRELPILEKKDKSDDLPF